MPVRQWVCSLPWRLRYGGDASDLRREAGGETPELIRLVRERGAMVPLHHAVSHARPDGSRTDVTLFPSRR